MPTNYTTKGKHLTTVERRLIERWKTEGRSHRQIAQLLGKAPPTINNEIKRSLARQKVRKGKFEMVYHADKTQGIYSKKRAKSIRSITLIKQAHPLDLICQKFDIEQADSSSNTET